MIPSTFKVTFANGLVLIFLGLLLFNNHKTYKQTYLENYWTQVTNDFKNIEKALNLYKQENGSYPVFQGWTGYYGFNKSDSNWIPKLVPKYISELPREPRRLIDFSQYLYRSDGEDYKLINHNTFDYEGDKEYLDYLEVDPKRPKKVVGIWTENAKYW